jgi:hypothetical protein
MTYVRVASDEAAGARSVLMTAEDAALAAEDMGMCGNVFARATGTHVQNEDGDLEMLYARLDPRTVSAA